MSELFGRRWTVQVNDLKITGLRVAFSVKKSLDKTPNGCKLTITNLAENSRKRIEQAKHKPLILSAGYERTEAVIFSGKIRFAHSARDSSDWHTEIESGDGEVEYAQNHFKGSFRAGTSSRDTIKAAAAALGVGLGNLESMVGALVKPTHAKGFSASGRASDVLGKLLAGQGLSYSIQNGQLQVLRADEPVDSFAVKLSASTGLIGSPEVGTPSGDGEKRKATIKLRSYLQPQIRCGGVVDVTSAALTGQYLVTHLEHQGDSSGAPWFSLIEVQPR